MNDENVKPVDVEGVLREQINLERLMDGVSPHKALRFTRTVARGMLFWSNSQPNEQSGGLAWQQLPTMIARIAMRVDLGWSWEEMPGRSPLRWKEIVRSDVPEFVPSNRRAILTELERCPGFTGLRGGTCRNPGGSQGRHVIDSTTGEWIYARYCNTHWTAARRIWEAAPTPPSNSGGVLMNTFPKHDIAGWVAKILGTESSQTSTNETTPAPPKLTVIKGGKA